jgi:Tfp pilus assembly protein PilE
MKSQQHNQVTSRKRNGLAIASLIIGILSILTLSLGLVGAIVGIVLGIIALKKVNANPEMYSGKGFAVGGIITSAFSIILGVGVLVIAVSNYYNAPRMANEANTIEMLKTIRTAQARYALSHNGQFGTPNQLVEAGFVDKSFVGERPIISGYVYDWKIVSKTTKETMSFYSINANPIISTGLEATGRKYFYIDAITSGIRVNEKEPASANDPLL